MRQKKRAYRTPFILAENNIETYWKLLKQLAGNKEWAKTLGIIGSEYIQHLNSLGVMVDSYVKLIEQVAKGDFV